jgi:hypothetical protein
MGKRIHGRINIKIEKKRLEHILNLGPGVSFVSRPLLFIVKFYFSSFISLGDIFIIQFT